MCCGLQANKRWELNRTWGPQLCFFSKQFYLSEALICSGQLHSVTGYCMSLTRPTVGTEVICLLWGVGQIGMSTLKWASTRTVSDDEAYLGFCSRLPWALISSVLHQHKRWDTLLVSGDIKNDFVPLYQVFSIWLSLPHQNILAASIFFLDCGFQTTLTRNISQFK